MPREVIADHEIELARERTCVTGDSRLGAMLKQLLDFRTSSRTIVAGRAPHVRHGDDALRMAHLVSQSGCQWWQCEEPARTMRMHDGEPRWLCRPHAAEGRAKGHWRDDPNDCVRQIVLEVLEQGARTHELRDRVTGEKLDPEREAEHLERLALAIADRLVPDILR